MTTDKSNGETMLASDRLGDVLACVNEKHRVDDNAAQCPRVGRPTAGRDVF